MILFKKNNKKNNRIDRNFIINDNDMYVSIGVIGDST